MEVQEHQEAGVAGVECARGVWCEMGVGRQTGQARRGLASC